MMLFEQAVIRQKENACPVGSNPFLVGAVDGNGSNGFSFEQNIGKARTVVTGNEYLLGIEIALAAKNLVG